MVDGSVQTSPPPVIVAPPLGEVSGSTLAYLAIQCHDSRDVLGTFLFVYGPNKSHRAVSPIFQDLSHVYAWIDDNGWKKQPHDTRYPSGIYCKDPVQTAATP